MQGDGLVLACLRILQYVILYLCYIAHVVSLWNVNE
jgi:hypothetical protein